MPTIIIGYNFPDSLGFNGGLKLKKTCINKLQNWLIYLSVSLFTYINLFKIYIENLTISPVLQLNFFSVSVFTFNLFN